LRWIAAEKERNDRVLPGKIDQLLVGKKGIGTGDSRKREQHEQR
jgi:hypothetical protein